MKQKNNQGVWSNCFLKNEQNAEIFQNLDKRLRLSVSYSKVPIIRTGTYASSAVHTMYCQNCPMFGTYNRSFRVVPIKSKVKISQNFVAFLEYMNFKR